MKLLAAALFAVLLLSGFQAKATKCEIIIKQYWSPTEPYDPKRPHPLLYGKKLVIEVKGLHPKNLQTCMAAKDSYFINNICDKRKTSPTDKFVVQVHWTRKIPLFHKDEKSLYSCNDMHPALLFPSRPSSVRRTL